MCLEVHQVSWINSKVQPRPLPHLSTATSQVRAGRLERKTDIVDPAGFNAEDDEKPVGAWHRAMMECCAWCGGSAQLRHDAVGLSTVAVHKGR